jgi:23S rRNA pseudouridine2605 synthase
VPGAPNREPQGERLQKVLAHAGLASRRQAEEWIRAGRVTVNGQPATLGQRVGGRDEVRIDGRVLRRPRAAATLGTAATVYLCHRSPGDDLRAGIIDRLPRRAGRRFMAVSPMPRVDGGLELVTTDGALAARLQRRVRESAVEFSVRIRGEFDEVRAAAILEGQLDDGRKVAVLELESSAAEEEGSNRWFHVATTGASGKDVRQLFERQGLLVSRVIRTALCGLQLTRDLSRGHFRLLQPEEARVLEPRSALGVEAPARDTARTRAEQRHVGAGQRRG